MFRRSRLSIRPNVGTAGRTAGSSLETTSNKDQSDADATAETPLSVTDKSADPPTEHVPSTDQSEESSNASAIQRRKRFSVRPKVVPGRPSAPPRTPKSPVKPVLPAVKSPAPVIEKAEPVIDATCAAPHKEQPTPKECQASDENSVAKNDSVSPPQGSSKGTEQPDKIKAPSCSQVKEISPKAPVPPSIPDREALDISEKAKTLVSKTELKSPSQHFSLTQLLNDKSDLVRMEKARKLRQLLKQEMLKEKSRKYAAKLKEFTIDPSKMTMRDLIHYLPTSNPMSSTAEDAAQDNETAFPQSPGREISPDRAQEQEAQAKMQSPGPGEGAATTSAEGEQEHEEEEADEADEAAEDEDALMVPQVKVAEDGSLIIDEESLTVEVQRMKGPNTIQDRDPIFERGSTTTYSSFRKGTYTKPWSSEETDMFFLAISMVGTDFAMISQLFPHRARSEIKNKFKREERYNAWRIDKAFKERQKLDLQYFKKLLEKILEFQESKKKLKSKTEKPKPRKRKAKGKKAVAQLSDVEEENEEEDFSIEEQEGEKENLCNEKIKRSKRKKIKDQLSPELTIGVKKKKRDNKQKKKLSDDATCLVDLQQDVTVPEDRLSLDQSKEPETQDAETAEIKSGKPPPRRSKDQKAKKAKGKKADVSTGEGETTVGDTEGQQSSKITSDSDSFDHKTIVKSARPSRYGRIPKPVQPLNYPAKEHTNSSASDTLASPTTTAKAKTKTRGKRKKSTQPKTEKESKKPKLITLRASQSEGSEDEEEETDAQEYEAENSTGAFVPASLCSPKPVIPEVEETMEEDVIDFISEHTEDSEEESYNEAAQTLLAIGNLTQPAESQIETSHAVSDLISRFEAPSNEEDDLVKSSFDKEDCTVPHSEPLTTDAVSTHSQIQPPSTSFTSDAQDPEPCENLTNIEQDDDSVKSSFDKEDCTVPHSEPLTTETLSTHSQIQQPSTSFTSVAQDPKPCENLTNVEQDDDLVKSSFDKEDCTVPHSEPLTTETVSMHSQIQQPSTSFTSDAQGPEPCNNLTNIEQTASFTHNSTPTAKNSLPQRKGRLSKIKPKPNISSSTRTTKKVSQTTGAAMESQQAELEIATTSHQPESLELPEECSPAVSDPSKTSRPVDDTTVVTTSPVSTPKVTSDPACKEDLLDSSLLQTTPEPNSKCSSPVRQQHPKMKPDTDCSAGPKNPTNGAAEEKSPTASEVTKVPNENNLSTVSHLRSLERQEESPQDVSGQDETCRTQESPTVSRLQTSSAKDSSAPRKGRLKLKPKPNLISCTSRATKLSSQSDHAAEVKIQEESKMTTISEVGSSEQSTASHTSSAHSQESNTTEKALETPQIETSGSNIPVPSMKERPSKVHAQTSSASITSKQSSETVATTDQKHHTVVLPHSESAVGLTEHFQQESLPCSSKKTDESITSLEQEIIPSAQRDPFTAEEKNENVGPVQLSDPSSESLKQITPQKRRWVPKAKPKPNLVSSSRAAKSRLESREKSEFTKSSSLNAATELPMPRDGSAKKSQEQLLPVDAEELQSTSSVPSVPDVSLGGKDTSQLGASGVNTNKPTFTPTTVSGSNSRSTEEITNTSKTDVIHEDPAAVRKHCKLGAEKQTIVDHCSLTESARSDPSKSGKTVHQQPELTLRNKEICLISKTSDLQTSEISAHHIQPVEGAADPPGEIQHDAVPPADSGQIQSRSPRNSFEYKSLLFSNIPPDQVPSDPNEPFFILSLTEIPVCTSGEEVRPNPEPSHAPPDPNTLKSNPLEPVVLLAAGIDDSLSNIHIPTPEKAALKSGHICVEEYLPTLPSVDISLLEEPRESPLVRRTNLPEVKESGHKKLGKSPNLMRKRAAKETDKPQHPTQDHPKTFTHIKCFEEVDSRGSHGPSAMKTTVGVIGNERIRPNTSDDPLWEQIETQSSKTPTSNVLTRSCGSKDTFTTASSELLGSSQGNSADVLDEEPTSVSEYFFRDVFTKVEDDCSVAEKTPGDLTYCDTTQGQPAETKANHWQLSGSPCGLEPMTALQKTETTVDKAAFTAPDTNIYSSQKETRVRGRGRVNRQNETSAEAKIENSRPQRKCKATKFPNAPPQDQESTPSRSTVVPQTCEAHQKSQRKSNRKAASDPSGGQPEATALRSLSIDETPADSSQGYTKTRRKRGSENKSNASCLSSQSSQRKSAEALKPIEDIAQSSVKETQSSSSAPRPQKRGPLSGSTVGGKPCRHPKDSQSPSSTQELVHEGSHKTHKQVEVEETRGEENSNRKNKAFHGTTVKSLRCQKQDTTSKSPTAIRDNVSASSSMLQASNQTNAKESSLFDDEPTNVSQYFLSDIFTDVDEEFKA